MKLDEIRRQLEERLKLHERYTGLASGDSVQGQIHSYHRLHALYDEHRVDFVINHLLTLLDGVEQQKLPHGMSPNQVCRATLTVFDLAIRAAEEGLVKLSATIEHPPTTVVLHSWKEAVEAFFRLILGENLPDPQKVISGDMRTL